jgi:predicted transcriptional regulator
MKKRKQKHSVPKPDWWDDLSEAAKASIERGLQDAKNGQLTPHDEVMKKYGKWLQ